MLQCFAAKARSTLHLLATLAVVSLTAAPTLADDKVLCVPPGDGVPGLGGPPEWLSGPSPNTAVDDPRWRGATAVNYGAAGAPHSRLRALQKNNKLYLSYQVLVDPDAALPQDSVYLALAPSVAGTHHLLRMQLTASSDVTANAGSVALTHLTWSSGAWNVAAAPTWAQDAAAWLTVDPGDGSAEWTINVKIAYTDAALGLGSSFKFWSGTAVQLTSAPPNYSTYMWPVGTQGPWSIPTNGTLNQDIPSTDWGDLNIGTAGCSVGVSLTMNNIGVKNGATLGSAISTVNNNTFAAWPAYNSVAAGAGKVRARFRIANWGSSTLWTDIPGFSAVDSDASGNIEKTCIQGGSPACPTPPAGQNHQCMLVELTSPANLTFLNDSVYRNMDFVNNSYFERDAEISLKGVPPLPNSKGKRDVYLYVDQKNMPKKARGPLDEQALRGALAAASEYDKHVYVNDPKLMRKLAPNERLPQIKSSKTPHELLKTVWPTYEVHVYYDSGQDLQVGNKSGRRLIPAPSFGFFVFHHGDLAGWLSDMVGLNAKLVEIAPHFYKVEVPDNGSIKLVNRIEGVEPGRTPTLTQIGKGGGPVGPPPVVCPVCDNKPPPKPGGCACTVAGGESAGLGLSALALAWLATVLWQRRRARRAA